MKYFSYLLAGFVFVVLTILYDIFIIGNSFNLNRETAIDQGIIILIAAISFGFVDMIVNKDS